MNVGDKFENLVANLGGGKDKLTADRFTRFNLGPEQAEAMYTADWLSRKIIDLPVSDMLRPWRSWQAEPGLIEVIEAAEKKHNIRKKIALAMTLARLYGGSGIIIGAGNVTAEGWRQPLNLEGVGKGGLRYLTVVPMRVLSVNDIDRDPLSPHYLEPKLYTLSSAAGSSVEVHPSRVIRFLGSPRPNIDTNADGWGDSILQIVYDAIHNASLSSTATASLIHEAKIDVINIKGMGAMLATEDGTRLLTKRFSLSNMLKSLNNTLLLDESETHSRTQTSFAGLPDLMQTFLQIVAGAADIPVTRLIGTSPKGLNATGDHDTRNYYDMLDGKRNDDLRPVLDVVDELLWRDATGSVPKDAFYTFNPLWQMTSVEKADLAHKRATTTKLYAEMALVPEEALAKGVANQLIEDEVYPGFEAEIEAWIAAGKELVPEDDEGDEDAEVRPSGNGSGKEPAQKDHSSPDRPVGLRPARLPDGNERLREVYLHLDEALRRGGRQTGAGGLSRH